MITRRVSNLSPVKSKQVAIEAAAGEAAGKEGMAAGKDQPKKTRWLGWTSRHLWAITKSISMGGLMVKAAGREKTLPCGHWKEFLGQGCGASGHAQEVWCSWRE